MKETFKMAWRNLGRNRKRTIITTASVFFAVFFACIQQSFHLGSWHSLLENVLHSYTGYLQIHAAGYWENKNFDYTMQYDTALENSVISVSEITGTIPRLESFALASSGDRTKPVIVAGILPDKEYPFTRLAEKLEKGSMLNASDHGAMLSRRLATYLNLDVGDTLLMISQGYAGTSAAGKFPVRGIIRLPAPEWDNQMVYLSLPVAQEFYSAENRITTLVVDLKNPASLDHTARQLSKLFTGQYEIMTWKEMLTELYQQYISDVGSGYILLALLYLVIGFGIFGTLMMMLNERRYELGVMIAVGMRKIKVLRMVTLEILLIAGIGILLGSAGALPLIVWFHYHPIELTGVYAKTMEIYGMDPVIPTLLQANYMIHQGIAVFVLTLLSLIWPAVSIFKLQPVKALRR